MSLMHMLKVLVESVTRTHILRSLPRGVDLANDLRSALPEFQCNVVLDVGANVGQSARAFTASFPRARIYCFEPIKATFEELSRNVSSNGLISCHRLALGADIGSGRMLVDGPSDRCHLLSGETSSAPGDTEDVQIATLDSFCVEYNICHISLLKVDTEGADLDVLKGATRKLAEQAIDVIELEAGMNPDNNHHVSFDVLRSYLEDRSYLLFGIYDQVGEWPTGSPNLRRTNPVFLSRRIVEQNRRPPPVVRESHSDVAV